MTHSFGSTEVWGNFLKCGIFFEEINSFLTKELFFSSMVLCAFQDGQWYLLFRLALQFFIFFTTEVNFYLNEPPPPTVDSQWGSYSGERERCFTATCMHCTGKSAPYILLLHTRDGS